MTRSRRRGAPVCALTVVIALLGASCGSSDRIDARALERVLPGQILADHPELLADVACPSPIDKRTGTITLCTGALAGTPVTITVTQLDDNGATSAALDKPIFDVAKSAATLAARFTSDLGLATTVDCDGPAVRVLVVGEVLHCVARDPSLRSRSLDVTVTDDAGTLAASLS